MSGRLSVVATPIGCLEDITLRALRVLGEADLILAEDTRHTRTLCAKHGISTPLRSFHAHSNDDKVLQIVEELANGAHYALVSDAGTPVVSDPGVTRFTSGRSGHLRRSIPGPSAVLAALASRDLPSSFRLLEGSCLAGRRPSSALKRIAHWRSRWCWSNRPIASMRPGGRRAVGATGNRTPPQLRRCTSNHSRHGAAVRGQLSNPARGEITVVIEGGSAVVAIENIDLDALVVAGNVRGYDQGDVPKARAVDLGWKRNRAYKVILDVSKPRPDLVRTSAACTQTQGCRLVPARPRSAHLALDHAPRDCDLQVKRIRV